MQSIQISIYSFSGNLSVTFDSGLAITIPNGQLVVPNYVVVGNQTVFDDDTREILVGGPHGTDPLDITYLGQPFFTSAYMMVNESTFTLWRSKATSEENLVPVDSSGTVCELQPWAPPLATGSVDPPQKKLSTGAIAGIAVAAGCAVLGAISIAVFCCCIRSKTRNHAEGYIQPNAHKLGPPAYPYQQKTVPVVEAPDNNTRYPPAFELPATEFGAHKERRDSSSKVIGRV